MAAKALAKEAVWLKFCFCVVIWHLAIGDNRGDNREDNWGDNYESEFLNFGFLDGLHGFRWHFYQGLWYRCLVDREIGKLKARK